MKTETQVAVFDFKKNWHLVLPHLPKAEKMLKQCMFQYLAETGRDGISYDPQKGPWSYSHRIEAGSKKIPKPGTCEWYEVDGGEFWLLWWQAQLGHLMFPKLSWMPCIDAGGYANGCDRKGRTKTIITNNGFIAQPSHRILRKSWNIAFSPATRQG